MPSVWLLIHERHYHDSTNLSDVQDYRIVASYPRKLTGKLRAVAAARRAAEKKAGTPDGFVQEGDPSGEGDVKFYLNAADGTHAWRVVLTKSGVPEARRYNKQVKDPTQYPRRLT